VALGAACEYLRDIGLERIQRHEEELGGYMYEQLSSIDVRLPSFLPLPTFSFQNHVK